jgi:hypothetical protein
MALLLCGPWHLLHALACALSLCHPQPLACPCPHPAVCTLADMHYDIFHATIDTTDDGWALLEFYVRPRNGAEDYDPGAALLLKAMLSSSIQRRFPKGLKVHVHSLDRFGCLSALASAFQEVCGGVGWGVGGVAVGACVWV